MRLFIYFFISFNLLFAELPPSIYKKWQDSANLVAVIKVLNLKKRIKDNKKYISAKAEVLNIIKSNLKPPKVVTIEYKTAYKQNFSSNLVPTILGPAPILELKKGQIYKAYLNKKQNFYIPAPGNRSFKIVAK